VSYIGNVPTTTAFLTDQFNGNGSLTAFTLSAAPANTNSIIVAVSGVLQSPDTYSVSGTTLTFSTAPPSGTGNISVRFLGIPASGVVTTAYRTQTEFTATAGQTTFNVPSYTVGYIDVYRNGAKLGTADFTATTGTTVVLASGASSGDLVQTVSFYVSSVLNAIPAVAGAVTDTYITSMDGSKLTGTQVIPKATLPTGSVLQVVSTFKNDTFSSSSQTFIDITGFSVSITPTSATSKILVICQFLSAATGANSPRYNLVRDSTNIAQPSGGNAPSSVQLNTASSSTSLQGCIVYLDSPATTSSTTYKLQGRTDGNSFVINRRGDNADATSVSSITVMEIAA
jgi:hypothetical protein